MDERKLAEQQFDARIADVEARISAACSRSGRTREEIQVVAVTKYVSSDMVRLALDKGYKVLGENRWQDAKEKVERFGDEAVWHFIGHLQTNKVKDVLGRFACIHSVDRISLATEIHKKAEALGISVPCFIQVNVSGEESKYGLPPEQLMEFAEQIRGLQGLSVAGLMTMAPYEAEPESTRPVFRGLRQLRDELNAKSILDKPVTELSMGMSNDFEVAIEEGATMIRLGSVLVGTSS
ncbi:YggS family pyridoxal phosphate-dependent enzyme [Paenibacillus turpanensis]|uniref:YggS family pyridoxal phosphate-dependent enzyme n=1 Tax=Paenibacillus turpanensis TaxID=2689078 RepID=UPI001409540D|nr:YggS family pyridoxal phosphate-dependent enzyme [Paenibacillus turpanensis]